MREIVLDTETTGLSPETGDRIVEIGALELMHLRPTGETYHVYINPERSMPQGAFDVHGLGDDFLRDKPVFADVANDFLDFIGESDLVIHNASFDMKFLNSELARMQKPTLPAQRAVDTLAMARQKFPGYSASLDALCRRFGVDTSSRQLHGALLDARLLAEVYFELKGGSQPAFGLEVAAKEAPGSTNEAWRARPRENPLPSRLSDAEAAAHEAFVKELGEDSLWQKLR